MNLTIPPFYSFQTSMNVLQIEDWVHVLRYVQILQDHSPAVVELDMLNLDMHAMVRIKHPEFIMITCSLVIAH